MRCLLYSVSFLSLTLASAQAETNIVITPLRMSAPAGQVASSITVITEEDIREQQKTSVVELLRTVPGVDITQNGGFAQTTRVLLRGNDSRHTLVLIDGVQVNDPTDVGGAYDFAHMTTDNIERIEILRGPQSTLYGSDAIGGVIQIFTKKGKGKPGVTASAETGSYGSNRFEIASRGSTEKLRYSVDASTRHSEGFSTFNKTRGGVEKDPYTNMTLSGNIEAQAADNLRFGVQARHHDTRSEYDTFGADAENVAFSEQITGRAFGILDLLDGDWQQEVGTNRLLIDRLNIDTFGNARYEGSREEYDWTHRLRFRQSNRVTVGFSTAAEEFQENTDPSRDTRTNAALVQHNSEWLENLYVTLGLRTDHHSTFGTHNTWRIAPSYLIAQTKTRLKASYGTGFKAPSLYQLFSTLFGEPTLKPEENKSYEFGFEQSIGPQWTVGSTWFNNELTNLIDFDFATFKYFNVGRARTRGLENTLSWMPDADTKVSLNHTYLLTEDKTTTADLVRRPKHKLSLNVDHSASERASLGFTLQYQGARSDNDFSFTRTQLKSYNLIALRGSFKLSPYATLNARVENLFDRDYEEVFGYGTPGTSAYVGVRVEY